MRIIPTLATICTLSVPLLGRGHAIVPLQHRGNEALALVYYDADAKAFDICSRLENTRQFQCSTFGPTQP